MREERKIPKKTKVVRIVPYNPVWKDEFERLRQKLTDHLGDIILKVEHVGSTSVEGLAAKPIIDLDIVIESYDVLTEVIIKLQELGYEHEGDLGIEGREAFRKVKKDDFMKHHLYVCPENSRTYREHIALRNYLRENEEAKQEYAELKKCLADKYRYDVDNYCKEKTDFIEGILARTLYAN